MLEGGKLEDRDGICDCSTPQTVQQLHVLYVFKSAAMWVVVHVRVSFRVQRAVLFGAPQKGL